MDDRIVLKLKLLISLLVMTFGNNAAVNGEINSCLLNDPCAVNGVENCQCKYIKGASR